MGGLGSVKQFFSPVCRLCSRNEKKQLPISFPEASLMKICDRYLENLHVKHHII